MLETAFRLRLGLQLCELCERVIPVLVAAGQLNPTHEGFARDGISHTRTLVGQEHIHSAEELQELNARLNVLNNFLLTHFAHLPIQEIAEYDRLMAEIQTPGIPGTPKREKALQRAKFAGR